MAKAHTMAGLSIVLKPTSFSGESIPLEHWLSNGDENVNDSPTWISLKRNRGITKAMPILARPDHYPTLLQSICQQLTEPTAIRWQGQHYDISGVEIEPDELYTIQLELNPSQSLPPTIGRAIHALFFTWISKADKAIATYLHQAKDNLPVILSSQRVSSRKIYLRITLLDKKLLSPLLWGMSEDLGTELKITAIPCDLSKHIQILSSSSFEKLSQFSGTDSLELEFLSPTSFRQQNYVQNFPLPELVFNSLLRRWNTFAPEHLHFPSVEWYGLVSAFDLKTHAYRMEGGPQIGAQGWVKYRFPDPEQARIATVLAHFATFAGVGRKTTMGMGQARLREAPSKHS